jgi:ribosomal protein L14
MYTKISIGATVLAVLGFAYYAVAPIFIHVRLDESAPQAKTIESETSTPEATTTLHSKATSVLTDKTGEEKKAVIVGTARHPASGSVRVINTENEAVVRYENFKTLNGPDLFVYLAKDLDAKEYVNLGVLKATEGNVNYTVPAGTDVSEYRYALIWCKQFGVLFNYADISEIVVPR